MYTMDNLQNKIRVWIVETFGFSAMHSKKERSFRALEEATEAIQAFLTKEEAIKVIEQVYAKPVEQELHKEIGGAIFTMIALAECNDIVASEALNNTFKAAKAIDPVKIITKHLTKPARDISLDPTLHKVLQSHKEVRNA